MSASIQADLARRMAVLTALLCERPVMNMAEASVWSQLSMQSLYRLTRSGELPTCAPGRVLREDLETYLRGARDNRSKQ